MKSKKEPLPLSKKITSKKPAKTPKTIIKKPVKVEMTHEEKDALIKDLQKKISKKPVIEEPEEDYEEERYADLDYEEDFEDDGEDYEGINQGLYEDEIDQYRAPSTSFQRKYMEQRKEKQRKKLSQEMINEALNFCDHRYAKNSNKYYVVSTHEECLVVAKKVTLMVQNTNDNNVFQPHQSQSINTYCILAIIACDPIPDKDRSIIDVISEIPEINDLVRVGCAIHRASGVSSIRNILEDRI